MDSWTFKRKSVFYKKKNGWRATDVLLFTFSKKTKTFSNIFNLKVSPFCLVFIAFQPTTYSILRVYIFWICLDDEKIFIRLLTVWRDLSVSVMLQHDAKEEPELNIFNGWNSPQTRIHIKYSIRSPKTCYY